MKFGIKTLSTAIATSLFAANASATVLLDFNGYDHGTVFTDQYAGYGVSVSADNYLFSNSNKDRAVIYDTATRPASNVDNRDPDLTGPSWGDSNLGDTSNIEMGGALIIQENSKNCGDGDCNKPDDEGGKRSGQPQVRPVGELTFGFDSAVDTFGFDLIDIEDAEAEWYEVEFFSAFTMNGTKVVTNAADFLGEINFTDFIASDGVDFGNNSLNRISPISLNYNEDVYAVRFIMGGSGAVDNIVYTTEVSEPATIGLFGLALMSIAALRRRKA